MNRIPNKPHRRIYDSIGDAYCRLRVPDPRIAARINQALGGAKTVCNVGAGTGSYEPDDRDVTAIEPSRTMIAQRDTDDRVVCASAESLPLADSTFDASMAILTIHHWADVREGLAEMQRISDRQVIFTFDADMIDSLWLARDYLPEILELERRRAVPIGLVVDALSAASVDAVEIPFDCTDGFLGAYWRRPEEYLKANVRAAISALSQIPESIVLQAMEWLSDDLKSGEWHSHYADLLGFESLDLGYRLVVAPAS